MHSAQQITTTFSIYCMHHLLYAPNPYLSNSSRNNRDICGKNKIYRFRIRNVVTVGLNMIKYAIT